MANIDVNFVESFRHASGERDGVLSFEEACSHVQCLKLVGPQVKPFKSDRPCGDLSLVDLPVRDLDHAGGKLEQFADIIQNFPKSESITIDKNFLDNTLYIPLVCSSQIQ